MQQEQKPDASVKEVSARSMQTQNQMGQVLLPRQSDFAGQPPPPTVGYYAPPPPPPGAAPQGYYQQQGSFPNPSHGASYLAAPRPHAGGGHTGQSPSSYGGGHPVSVSAILPLTPSAVIPSLPLPVPGEGDGPPVAKAELTPASNQKVLWEPSSSELLEQFFLTQPQAVLSERTGKVPREVTRGLKPILERPAAPLEDASLECTCSSA
jgi:hypothetical protein